MGQVNYENLLAELIKPLVAHPEDVETIAVESNEKYCKIAVKVNKEAASVFTSLSPLS